MSDHVTEATWEQLAMNELSSAARAEALRHALACSQCRTIYRGLRTLEADARAQDLLPTGTSRRRGWITGAAVALAAAAALLVWWRVRGDGQPDVPVLRGSGLAQIAVTSSASVHAGDRITWSAVDKAAAYRIEVFTAEGKPAWTERTPATEIQWPALPAAAYRWRVTARSVDGIDLGVSRLTPIEVAP